MAKYHIVKKNETLSKITKMYYGDMTFYPQLAAINGIENPDRILVGQKIVLPNSIYRGGHHDVPDTEGTVIDDHWIITDPDGYHDFADEGGTVIELKSVAQMCQCTQPEDNFPYEDDTFELVARLKEQIMKASDDHSVPPVAVAGAIADEYNTRYSLKKAFGLVDWFQDNIWIHSFSNEDFRMDAFLDRDGKIRNATKNDIGVANIKVETAMMIYERYRNIFQDKCWDYKKIVDYLLTDGGTVHMAALVIKHGQELLYDEIEDYPSCAYEAVLVSFYKQGREEYIEKKWKTRKAKDPTARIRPGEGCRVCLQRDRFLGALGLD